MIRPRDLSIAVTNIIARATQSQAVWRPTPMTSEEFAEIRVEVWRYFDQVRAEMEKEAEGVTEAR
jgi:hypothetical protein